LNYWFFIFSMNIFELEIYIINKFFEMKEFDY